MKEEEVRRCALTGVLAPPSALLRFVLSPQGQVVFDRRQDLPGKDVWLRPSRELVMEACRSGVAAWDGNAIWHEDLPAQVEAQLRQQALGTLALLRRSGGMTSGFEKVQAALRRNSISVLVQAADAAEDGKVKLAKLARHHHIPVIGCFRRDELGQVSGQENQVHLALSSGGLSDKFLHESRFLQAYLGHFSSHSA